MALSAPLLTRKKVIKVKIEAEKGTKLAGDQAILVFDLAIRPTAPFVERKGTGLYRGHSEPGVLEERSGTCSFSAELRGTAGAMEAGIAILLQACALEKTLEVFQVHSVPATDSTISIDVWEDGVKKGLAGASGNVTFEGVAGKRMMCNFEFSGIWQATIDEALPAYAPSTDPPMRVQGGTFTLGGESIKINSFSLNMGCNVVMRGDVDGVGGIAHYMITDYDPVVSMDPEADKVAGYDYNGIWQAGTEGAISLLLTDGTTTITIAIPKFQYREIPGGDRDGIQTYEVVGQCNHDSGDDSVVITAAAA